jgi:hypothetical protein
MIVAVVVVVANRNSDGLPDATRFIDPDDDGHLRTNVFA